MVPRALFPWSAVSIVAFRLGHVLFLGSLEFLLVIRCGFFALVILSVATRVDASLEGADRFEDAFFEARSLGGVGGVGRAVASLGEQCASSLAPPVESVPNEARFLLPHGEENLFFGGSQITRGAIELDIHARVCPDFVAELAGGVEKPVGLN